MGALGLRELLREATAAVERLRAENEGLRAENGRVRADNNALA
ncbi:MAG TPA: hypothetical protein VG184_00765 [Acidimicrobiales bacterium]|nr:hypothetical protein [Acidimicrobiales bacterium]